MMIKKASGGIFIIALLMLSSISGCNRETPDSGEIADERPMGFSACTEPRPEVCTQIYQPVCALVDSGVRCVTSPCPPGDWQTRGNACTACSDEHVSGYIDGECAPEQVTPPTQ